MWAVAAQPRSGLTPMIPTPSRPCPRDTCTCKYRTVRCLQMQVDTQRGLETWHSLLQAHATLMRRLTLDLERETGLALADFDVLAQLSLAGGELRMTELAARALISRSGMTRRAARLGAEGRGRA